MPGAGLEHKEKAAHEYSAQRDTALDGVRGLGMLMVVLVHGFLPAPVGPVTQVISNSFESFFVAVDSFFVLSGFLITTILIRSRGSEGYLRQFYWRRILRIGPAYSLAMIGCFLVMPFFLPADHAAEIRGMTLPHLFYVQNLVAAAHGPMPTELSHYWSLAIEEQFYLVWPVVVMLVPLRRLPWVCAGLFAAGCAFKVAMYLHGASWLTLYVFTPCHIEGLAAGAWIASNRQIRSVLATPRWLRLAGLAASLALLYLALAVPGRKLFDPFQVTLHNLLSAVGSAWLIYALVNARPGAVVRRLFDNRVLRLFGTYSYSIYLMGWVMVIHLQYPALRRLSPYMSADQAQLLSGLVVTSLNIGLAMLLYHFVEKPVLGFKDRGPGRRRPSPVPVAAPPAIAE